jgi:flavorubredoxin
VCRTIDPRQITAIFASHQDPDVISSLSLWLELNPALPVYTSWLWTTFIPHFGGEASTFKPIPDEGMEIRLGSLGLQAVPAHYLHSSGNFHLYDPAAKVYFSGDVGAALLPGEAPLMVTDFDRHIVHAETFHSRWMGSNEAKLSWCERVSKLEIDLLCPQHGSIYSGADVSRFINWFSELKVGVLKTPGSMRQAA